MRIDAGLYSPYSIDRTGGQQQTNAASGRPKVDQSPRQAQAANVPKELKPKFATILQKKIELPNSLGEVLTEEERQMLTELFSPTGSGWGVRAYEALDRSLPRQATSGKQIDFLY